MKFLDRLETFIVLSESNSFTEAAKKLYCSQPTISHHIRYLEEMFEANLIDRSKKTITFTEQGEVLLHYAKQLKQLLEEAQAKVKKVEEKKTVSLYMSRYLADYFIAPYLNRLQKVWKEMIHFYSYCYDDLKNLLLQGAVDYALMPIYEQDKELMESVSITPLIEDEFVLILSPNHVRANRKQLYSRDLANEMVLLPQSKFLQQFIKEHMKKAQVRVNYLQMSNFDMIKMAVKANYGIAFIPLAVVKKDIEDKTLVTLPISIPAIKRKNGLFIRKDAQLSQIERNICKEIIQITALPVSNK